MGNNVAVARAATRNEGNLALDLGTHAGQDEIRVDAMVAVCQDDA